MRARLNPLVGAALLAAGCASVASPTDERRRVDLYWEGASECAEKLPSVTVQRIDSSGNVAFYAGNGSLLTAFATCYSSVTSASRVTPRLERALAAKESTLGAAHSEVATELTLLAEFLTADRAGPLSYMTDEAIRLGEMLHRGARIEFAAGADAEAEKLVTRSVEVYQKHYGADHPGIADRLRLQSALYARRGDVRRAVEARTRGEEVIEKNLALVLAVGSEAQKRLYLDTVTAATDETLSLHADVFPEDAAARRLALTTAVRRKGRILDVMADATAALRRSVRPEDRDLFDRWVAAREQLAAATLRREGDADPATLRALTARSEELESATGVRWTPHLHLRAEGTLSDGRGGA